jgi:hypothetical protein
LSTECITEQKIQELCAKHGFIYENDYQAVFHQSCLGWSVINIEFQMDKLVRLHLMKYVYDSSPGHKFIKTKNSGVIKRVYGLTCKEFEKYLEDYNLQYKKAKITEQKYLLNEDFNERKDTE